VFRGASLALPTFVVSVSVKLKRRDLSLLTSREGIRVGRYGLEGGHTVITPDREYPVIRSKIDGSTD